MLFYLFIAAIVFVFFKVVRDIVKFLDRFFDVSSTRRAIWISTNCLLFFGASLPLLFGAFQRWYYFHDEMFYSGNKKQLTLTYADQVDTRVYLMSHQNVIDLFEGNSPNPDTQTIPKKKEPFFYNKQNPSDPRFYLVIGLKNNGEQFCCGILQNYANGEKAHTIDIPTLAPRMNDYKYIVIRAWSKEQNMPGDYPQLEAKWFKLYTSKRKGS